MPTKYVFTHERDGDEWRVLHLGKHLVTTAESCGRLVQAFEDEAAARAHIDCFTALRKRAGYAVREFEQAHDAIVLPPELTGDPLARFASWHDHPRRLVLVLYRKMSAETHANIVDRIQTGRPSRIDVDLSSKRPPTERFSQAFVGRTLPTVRDLSILNVRAVHATFPHGDLGKVFGAMPTLRRVVLNGDLLFHPLQHSALRELHLVGDPIRVDLLEALGACSFPALRHLRIVLREEVQGRALDAASAIALSTLDAPDLESLRVQGIEDITHFLEELLARRLRPSVHTLRLEGEIRDEDALVDVLTRHVDVLRPLRKLALPLLDEISTRAAQRVKDLLPQYVDESNVPYYREPKWRAAKDCELVDDDELDGGILRGDLEPMANRVVS